MLAVLDTTSRCRSNPALSDYSIMKIFDAICNLEQRKCSHSFIDVPIVVCLQLEIKQFLERVYGLRVAAIQTLNYEGKKKRRKTGKRTSAYFRGTDYKKVLFKYRRRLCRKPSLRYIYVMKTGKSLLCAVNEIQCRLDHDACARHAHTVLCRHM